MNTLQYIFSETDAKLIAENEFGVSGIVKIQSITPNRFKITTDKKASFILNLSTEDNLNAVLIQQQNLASHLLKKANPVSLPEFLTPTKNQLIATCNTTSGNTFFAYVQTHIPGRAWQTVNPQSDDLRLRLGEFFGKFTADLTDFTDFEIQNNHPEPPLHTIWKKIDETKFSHKENQLLTHFHTAFKTHLEQFKLLPKSIHINNLTEQSILVNNNFIRPEILGLSHLINLNYSQTISHLSKLCALAITNQTNPLQAALPIVQGFNKNMPLCESELQLLYYTIAMEWVSVLTQSSLNGDKAIKHTQTNSNKKAIWNALNTWQNLSPEFAYFSFRAACGLKAHPEENSFLTWLNHLDFKLSDLFPSIKKNDVFTLDLSVSGNWIGNETELNNLDFFQNKLNTLQQLHPDKIIAGGYLEPRALYTSTAYDTLGNQGKRSRTIHLGVDYWLPENTPIYALTEGKITTATYAEGDKNYGGLIIIEHPFNNHKFYTLYGHLSIASISKHQIGDIIKKGEHIADLGRTAENGNWIPHLHFQIMLSLLNFKDDFPGVTFFDEADIWKSICPNPNLLFKTPCDTKPKNKRSEFVCELGNYLLNESGKKYLNFSETNINNLENATSYLTPDFISDFFLKSFKELTSKHPIFGKTARNENKITTPVANSKSKPLPLFADYIVERLKAHNILIDKTGTDKNILSIKLSSGLTLEQINDLLYYLDKILKEDFLTHYKPY